MQLVVNRVNKLNTFVQGDKQSKTKKDDIIEDNVIEVNIIEGDITISFARQVKSNMCLKKAQTSEKIRRIMQRESNVQIRVRLNISVQRQVCITITQKFIKEEYRFNTNNSELDKYDRFDKDNKQRDSVQDL